MAIECLEQGVDVDQRPPMRRGAARREPPPGAQILDLRRVALGRGDQTLAATVEQDDRVVEMIQQRRGELAAEVRKEEVEPLLVHARREQLAIALPLLTHVIAQRGASRGAQPTRAHAPPMRR